MEAGQADRCQPECLQYAIEIWIFLLQNPQNVLEEEKILHILTLYENWSVCRFRLESEQMSFEKYVLYYIVERTYWSDVKNGEFVAQLLRYVYQNQSGLHLALYQFQQVDYSHENWFRWEAGNNIHLTRFFLNHAYKQRFTINGWRMADLTVFPPSTWLHPCEMAIYLGSSQLLLLLLQYGAFITQTDDCLGRALLHQCCYRLSITWCFKQAIHFYEYPFQSFLESEEDEKRSMILCAKYIVRSCPQLDRQLLTKYGIFDHLFENPLLQGAIPWITSRDLPDLPYLIIHPRILQHACRIKIRKVLHDNWQLPHGIDNLPLPRLAKKYLNLEV